MILINMTLFMFSVQQKKKRMNLKIFVLCIRRNWKILLASIYNYSLSIEKQKKMVCLLRCLFSETHIFQYKNYKCYDSRRLVIPKFGRELITVDASICFHSKGQIFTFFFTVTLKRVQKSQKVKHTIQKKWFKEKPFKI